jgi:uncharacterized protein (TIGR03546 family)
MKFLKRRAVRQYIQMRRFVVHNLLHADDPPHRLALGVAIGWFWTFTPFLGIQMIAVVATAWLLRANKLVGVPLVWLSNPATFVPLFYPCYRIGLWVLGMPGVNKEWWSGLGDPPEGFVEITKFYWSKVMEIFSPLMLGCLIVGIPSSIICYIVVRVCVEKYRATMHLRPLSRRRRLASATGMTRKDG